ncbi:hypothetical protein BGX28_004478 [Mortierella sp. GBA30]|nr:hypothetical protein BGX28_004478 [Mortierella sp. GBA30]
MSSIPSSRRCRVASSLTWLLLASNSFLLVTIDAQTSLIPTPVWGSTYTHQENVSFLISGGQTDAKTLIGQTFSIDLSTAWDTSSVPYKRLPDGPADFVHASALLKDKQNWVVATNGTVNEYSLTSNTWSSSGSTYLGKYNRIPAAADPATDLIYFPNSYFNQTIQMLQYDIVKRWVNFLPMHPVLANVFSYSAAWNVQLKKMMVFGGATNGNYVNNNLYTWDSTNGWVAVSQYGSIPSPRRSACMVPAYGGAKMVVFGGLTQFANAVLSDIYVLDVATMTWTQGIDAGVTIARTEPACAVSNDLFIAWGGAGVSTVISSNLTVIYNIKRNIWQSSFSPLPDPGPSTGSGSGGSSSDSGNSNMGAIIGGAVGGVAVIALFIGFFVYRSKKNKKQVIKEAAVSGTNQQQHQHQHPTTQPDVSGGYATAPVYAMSDVNAPLMDPWQQQLQQQQQQAMVFSQPSYPPTYSTYSTYQPPIIHDYQQQQQAQMQPQIFQLQSQSPPDVLQQQPLYPNEALAMSTSSPPMSNVSYDSPSLSMSMDPYRQSTVYQPSSDTSTVAALSPVVDNYQKPTTAPQNANRVPQNPQMIPVPDTYMDFDGHPRSPQAS